MDKIKFGIVGIGHIGFEHAHKLFNGQAEEIELTALCDLKKERLEEAKAAFGDKVQLFDDAETMFRSGVIDSVIIAVPHYDHPRLAIAAMKCGLNVIIEKPAGVYLNQVIEMNKAADETGAVFAIMLNQRTNCVYRKMREIIKSGEMGDIRRTNWIITDWYRPQAYYDSGDWRATWSGEGGGVLLNQSPHNLDLWQWICGMPKTIEAKMYFGKWHNIEVEDDVTIYAEYENGATGVFVTTTGDIPGTNRFEVQLDKGKLLVENNELYMWKTKDGISESEFSATNKKPFSHPEYVKTKVETDGENPQHIGVFRAFAAHILHGTPLIADGREGINGLSISNAAHLSAFTGKTVEIASMDNDLFYEELMKRAK